MLFSPDTLLPTGPPPQAVLDQRWLWQILLALLGITLCLRLIGLDVAGALLTGLMLYFGIVMTRDGMQEMAKYAIVYAMLCGLNFFFDVLPLITELGGRVSKTTEPVSSTTSPDGVQKTTYTLTTETTPFFDPSQGFIYNVQSCAMITSPICMALGWYLATTAHTEMQRHSPELFQDEFMAGPAWAGPAGRGAGMAGGAAAARHDLAPGAAPVRTTAARANPRETFERFQGQAHTLE